VIDVRTDFKDVGEFEEEQKGLLESTGHSRVKK
jgi:hypothetical protein